MDSTGKQFSRHFPGKELDPAVEAESEVADRFMRAVDDSIRISYPGESFLLEKLVQYSDAVVESMLVKVEQSGAYRQIWLKTLAMFIKRSPSEELLEGFVTSSEKERLTSTYTLYSAVNAFRGYLEYEAENQSSTKAPAYVNLAGALVNYARNLHDSPDKLLLSPPLDGLRVDENGVLEMLVENPGHSQLIYDTIADRCTIDSAVIRSVLQHESKPLSIGLL